MVNVSMKKRIGFVFLCTATLLVLLVTRVFWIQFIQGKDLQEKALNNRLRDIEVKAKRGVIYDSNGSPLAISVSTGSVYAVPAQVKKSGKLDETATKLAEILELDEKKVKAKLEKNIAFEWIKRRVPDEKVKKIKELKLPGINFVEENQRYYPKGKLAAHVLGFAGIDNQGLNGLELSYDKVLSGVSGKIMIEYDALNREIPNALHQYIMPRDGHSLYLTIDETIQYIAERELDNVMKVKKAKHGTVLVMDVKTGSILAMANRPVFDPNNYAKYDSKTWRNYAITDVYEPGSTFKPVTASAALEEKTVNDNDRFYCPGYIKVGKERIKCWKHEGHGSETFVEGVQNSCNPVFVTVGLRLGKEAFYKYLEGFGFGQKTGIELPGEAYGLLVGKKRCKDIDLASMSMGQANAVTPIQLIRSLSAIANDGWLMKPRLVKEIRDFEGNLVKKIEPEKVRQVISKETSQRVRTILESVVSEGTGKAAQIEGYKVAGKTGTAQKILPQGGYSRTDFIVSFAGFAPADNPEVACLVVIDSPEGLAFGGLVAGPVFKNVVKDTLRYLKVPADFEKQEKSEEKITLPDVKKMKIEDANNKLKKIGLEVQKEGEGKEVLVQLPPAGTTLSEGSQVILYTNDESSTKVVVPDLKGTTIREASSILSKLQLKIAPQGSGLASLQEPLPGTKVEKGTTVTVRFASLSQQNVEETMGP